MTPRIKKKREKRGAKSKKTRAPTSLAPDNTESVPEGAGTEGRQADSSNAAKIFWRPYLVL